MPRRPPRKPSRAPRRLWPGVLLLVAVICLLGAAGWTVTERLRAPGTTYADPGPGASDLSLAERIGLGLYLQLRTSDLQRPAGSDPTRVAFTVSPGESAADVAARLADAGLIVDAELFIYYVRYHGLDARIEAGRFELAATQTVPEIAAALAHATPDEAVLTVIEGWRMEQIAEALPAAGLTATPEEFLSSARSRRAGYSFSGDIPPAAGMEGFLFPDTYRFKPGVSAAAVVDAMLHNFDQRVTGEIRASAAAHGLSLYQLITLASIIEREAVVEDERALIASVFHNRLAQGIALYADPTIQYALGFQPETGEWWKRPLSTDDLAFDSPYNTYRYAGLPPTPISNPGLSSIRAAAFPAQSDYLYFRARCDGSGRHSFAVTLDEHNANACS